MGQGLKVGREEGVEKWEKEGFQAVAATGRGTVRISGPWSVVRTVCSKCAEGEPSKVTWVQPCLLYTSRCV